MKVISKNRKAFHEYEIGESFEAGMELRGTEVKALRAGKVNLQDGWVEITNRYEAYLKEVHIGHYSHGNINNHLETRDRRLLLHKKEIKSMSRFFSDKGNSIVPIKIYFKDSTIKVEIAMAKGKKLHDKRESSKEKDAVREISKAMKKR
ncbi:MAG: SsrA-binding protein SmpB [Oligoflexales bacterium]|nr:SsrA-binding protein SmpB [Oligoflexales bacterium]